MYYNGFFGLFTDNRISKKQFTFFFFLKLLAVPVFYTVYAKLYGGIEKFDSGIFYNDSKALNAFARKDFPEYLKAMVGLQDDSFGSYFFKSCIVNTHNWDNGRIKDYLYNDNRVLIRIHSVLDFIAFNSYFAHALFSCFLSFVGLTSIYKTIKEYFAGKELAALFALCFLPALWFYTGGLLKEGITIFFLGSLLLQLKKTIYGNRTLKGLLWLAFLLFISLLLKPYLLFFAAMCFSLFFIIYRSTVKRRLLIYFSVIALCVLCINTASLVVKHKSLVDAALNRQQVFAGAATGGIFLENDRNFVRLAFDSTLVAHVPGKPGVYTIKKNSPYMYWKNGQPEDTLYCDKNMDTLVQFQLVYMLPESGSNVDLANYRKSVPGVIGTCWYYSLFYPMFFNAKSALQLLASAENLAIIVAFLVIFTGLFKHKKVAFIPVVFVFFALSVCLLIGLTTPNSGAIFRYRGPVVIFILLAALYYIRPLKKDTETPDPGFISES